VSERQRKSDGAAARVRVLQRVSLEDRWVGSQNQTVIAAAAAGAAAAASSEMHVTWLHWL